MSSGCSGGILGSERVVAGASLQICPLIREGFVKHVQETLRPSSGVDVSSTRATASQPWMFPHKDPREEAELGILTLHPGASRQTGSSLQEEYIYIIEGGRRTVTIMNTITFLCT